MREIVRIISLILLFLQIGGCAKEDLAKMSTVDDLANKRIGVLTGSVFDKFVLQRFPSATVLRYDSSGDFIVGLKSGKIDAVVTASAQAKVFEQESPDIGILSDNFMTFPIGVGFHKDAIALRERFNTFLRACKADGSLNAMYKKWFETDGRTVRMPSFVRKASGERLVLGCPLVGLPNVGFVDGEYIGFDVEMMKTFAQKENIDLEVIPLDFGALIASLKAGKVNMIVGCISITEERQKEVAFSDPYMEENWAVIARKRNIAYLQDTKNKEEPSFLQSFTDGFYNNIVHEKRYMLILGGLNTTVVISIFSILFGTPLGALICFMRMSAYRILARFAKIYISLVRGIPVLVLLMIIYYVLFAKSSIAPVFVAVLAFGINFAAYVSEMFRTSIESIDKGQTEAGIAGGFSRVQTFVHIVMPQAIKQVLPVYKGEIISMVKMTSIVGYIAVQDLTKASDIIRSRTFDAFFPLLMTAALYFAISSSLLLLLGIVEQSTDPRRRRRRVKAHSREALLRRYCHPHAPRR